MNRYKYLQNKPEVGKPKLGQIWSDGKIHIRLDKRLVPSHNIVIWDATLNVWGEATKTQISEKTLLEKYELWEKRK